jgi:hypothetical protein
MTTPSAAPLVHESLGERVYRSRRGVIPSQVGPPGSRRADAVAPSRPPCPGATDGEAQP